MKKHIQLLSLILLIPLLGVAETDPNKPFDINDYQWLAGTWTGDGFGGTSEEMWSKPSADGTMMGVYRHHKGDGTLNFYEFMVLDKTGLKLKHFNPDMMAWETKEDFVHFEMIDYSADKIEMKGLVFERKSDTEMEIRLKMRYGEEIKTEVFKMKRQE